MMDPYPYIRKWTIPGGASCCVLCFFLASLDPKTLQTVMILRNPGHCPGDGVVSLIRPMHRKGRCWSSDKNHSGNKTWHDLFYSPFGGFQRPVPSFLLSLFGEYCLSDVSHAPSISKRNSRYEPGISWKPRKLSGAYLRKVEGCQWSMWLSSSNMVSAWIFWMALGISRFTGSSLKRAGAPTSLQACRWSSWRIWQLPQFPLHFSFLFVSCWCRAQEGAGWSCHEHIRHHLATRFFFFCAFLKSHGHQRLLREATSVFLGHWWLGWIFFPRTNRLTCWFLNIQVYWFCLAAQLPLGPERIGPKKTNEWGRGTVHRNLEIEMSNMMK